jgi:hypothetical protein
VGHAPGCQFFHAEDEEGNAALRARVEALERAHAQLVTDLNLSGPDSACCRARHRAEDARDKLVVEHEMLIAKANELRTALIDVCGFLHDAALRYGAQDLIDEANALDRLLDAEKSSAGGDGT